MHVTCAACASLVPRPHTPPREGWGLGTRLSMRMRAYELRLAGELNFLKFAVVLLYHATNASLKVI